MQIIARESNWGIYPLLINQFVAPYCVVPSFQAFEIIVLILVLTPTAYFTFNIKKTLTLETKTLGYWAFYVSMVHVLFTDSGISSSARYAIPMLPIYWVLAKIYTKKRLVGAVLFAVITTMLVIAAYMLETANPNLL